MSVYESIYDNIFYKYMRRFPIVELNKEDKKENENNNKIKTLMRRKNSIDREQDKIQRAWIKDMMSDDDLSRHQKELDKELSQINDELYKMHVKREIVE